MSFFKIKLRPADRLFTKYIRLRDNYTCVKCGRAYSPDNCRNLGVSHFYGRANEGTRFDPENCDALCTIPCHQKWGGEGRREYEDWKLNQLGQERFDLLTLRAHTPQKKDDAMNILVIKELLKGAA